MLCAAMSSRAKSITAATCLTRLTTLEFLCGGQIPLDPALRQDADNGRIAELRRLLEEGLTQDQVADKLGVSQSFVSENRGETGSGKRGRKKTATVH